MALIGRLIREARNGATELCIRPQDIGPLAAHVRTVVHPPLTDKQARTFILCGDLKMAGVPVRVLGE